MSISYDQKDKIFHLTTKETSYIMQLTNTGYLLHGYWGKKIHSPHRTPIRPMEDIGSFCPNPEYGDTTFSLDNVPREYPDFGRSDFKNPAYVIEQENGSKITEAKFDSYKIYKGKPKLQGLPSTYSDDNDDVETLEITLKDKLTNIYITLIYSVYYDYNVITRSAKFTNEGSEKVTLQTALSMNVDFYNDADFELINLYGSWARERHIERQPLGRRTHIIDSKRGSSSHQQNPFIALARENTTEDSGEVYGFNFVFSGSFKASVEVSPFKVTRVQMGINDFDFKWNLHPDKSFQTPEVVMVYSDQGLNKMSQTYHKLYREKLCKSAYKDKERPILINNWEATYFDFNEEKIISIAKKGAELGMELFVLDDGWFGKRDSDESGLGDWVVNKEKLPNGIKGLSEAIHAEGLKFGLWFEPEMICPDSDLYREHSDWCLHVPNRSRSQARNQLILDLSRDDVCEYIIDAVSKVLSTSKIDYVKWDMNRNMTEVGSALLSKEQQGETTYRYMLGLYKILEEITGRFPDILFESCSGGGGRFDPGMLHYMPQTWTSDDTDAVERLYIQYGTSLVYPTVAMASHVSAVPNHQVGRSTSLTTRAHTAMAGNFGYELDLTKLEDEEAEMVKNQIQVYKKIRRDVQYGTFYRLLSPYKGNKTAWMVVSEDEKRITVFYYRMLKEPTQAEYTLKLAGLKDDKQYKCITNGQTYYGDELMYMGIEMPHMYEDFSSLLYEFEMI